MSGKAARKPRPAAGRGAEHRRKRLPSCSISVSVSESRSIIAERFADHSEQGQQHDRNRVQQPQAVVPLGRAEVNRSQAHAETRILGVAQPALGTPNACHRGWCCWRPDTGLFHHLPDNRSYPLPSATSCGASRRGHRIGSRWSSRTCASATGGGISGLGATSPSQAPKSRTMLYFSIFRSTNLPASACR